MSPRIVDKTEKRAIILRAALDVFADRGYRRTKMEEVAQAAGIGKGTVYEYFNNKEALFFALYGYVQSAFQDAVYREAEKQTEASLSLKILITETLKALTDWRQFGSVLLDFWSDQRLGESVHFSFSNLYALSRERIAGLIQRGVRSGEFREVDPIIASAVVIALLDGILLQRTFDPSAISNEGLGNDIADIILNGLKGSSIKQ